jgi:hypothetical protein
MEIAIDFDGTCVTHEYPEIGKDIGAVPILKQLIENGHDLILYTMRSGVGLENALQWFLQHEIKLFGVQYNPDQARWTSSNKCYAQLYIDDAALGCPLIDPGDFEGKVDGRIYVKTKRSYVDWKKVEQILIEKGIL